MREAPEGGKANAAICKALAEHLGIPKSKVSVISGMTAKNKWVEVR